MAWTRKEILNAADECVNGSRDHNYGTPENNFTTVASFWNTYISAKNGGSYDFPLLYAHDVAAMLALLKLARISSGQGKTDNWIDLAGYAACGGEVEEIWRGEQLKTFS